MCSRTCTTLCSSTFRCFALCTPSPPPSRVVSLTSNSNPSPPIHLRRSRRMARNVSSRTTPSSTKSETGTSSRRFLSFSTSFWMPLRNPFSPSTASNSLSPSGRFSVTTPTPRAFSSLFRSFKMSSFTTVRFTSRPRSRRIRYASVRCSTLLSPKCFSSEPYQAIWNASARPLPPPSQRFYRHLVLCKAWRHSWCV